MVHFVLRHELEVVLVLLVVTRLDTHTMEVDGTLQSQRTTTHDSTEARGISTTHQQQAPKHTFGISSSSVLK